MINYTKIVKDCPKTWGKLKKYYKITSYKIDNNGSRIGCMTKTYYIPELSNNKLFEFFDKQGLEGYYYKTLIHGQDKFICHWYIAINRYGESFSTKDYPERKDIENYLIEKLFYELEERLNNE